MRKTQFGQSGDCGVRHNLQINQGITVSTATQHIPLSFSQERYHECEGEISLRMSHFFLGYIKELHRHFEGDLTLVIVLAEIAHHSSHPHFPPSSDGDKSDGELWDGAGFARLPSCSAYSLATATGLPRETVRRKIARLIELGWIEKTGRAEVRITPKVAEHFTPEFNIRLLDQFLQTADRIRGVLSNTTKQTK